MVQCGRCSAELLPCPQLLGNASARSRCAKAQGWTRKGRRHTWNCPACTARYRQVPESVPTPESICLQSHGVVAPCRDLPEPSHGYPAPSHVEGARQADPAPSHVEGARQADPAPSHVEGARQAASVSAASTQLVLSTAPLAPPPPPPWAVAQEDLIYRCSILCDKAAMEDVIRCCSLGIPRVLLEEQGLCKELRRRVSVLLRKNMSEPDFARMLSKLGKAKYEMFTPGAKFNNRKARRKRPSSQGDPDPGSVEESTHISSAVADFLAEDLSSRIESAVEGFLDDYLAGVTVETESAFSEDLSHPQLVQTGGATSSAHGNRRPDAAPLPYHFGGGRLPRRHV